MDVVTSFRRKFRAANQPLISRYFSFKVPNYGRILPFCRRLGAPNPTFQVPRREQTFTWCSNHPIVIPIWTQVDYVACVLPFFGDGNQEKRGGCNHCLGTTTLSSVTVAPSVWVKSDASPRQPGFPQELLSKHI